jgi:hypothetical protein
MAGRNTETVSTYCARLNSTVAIGRIALGKSTLLRSPELSTIAPVDIGVETMERLLDEDVRA